MENLISEVTEIAYSIKKDSSVREQGAEDLPLTGDKLCFSVVEMCYLALEVMAHFNIRLEADDIDNKNFNTIRSIAERIALRK